MVWKLNGSGRAVAVALVALFLSIPGRALTPEERGDRAFRQRAAGFLEHGTPSPGPTEAAIAAYEEALEQDPENLRLHFKLMDALYFKGYFVVSDRDLERQLYERLVGIASRAVELTSAKTGRQNAFPRLSPEEQAELLRAVPEAVGAHFWAAASWGLWGMTHSRLSAVRKGVVAKVRDHARMVVLLDERYDDAGGLRLLGRLHTLAPRVPFITGWIDRREGIELLRRAADISRRDPRNPFFLAEALLAHDPDGRAEALELLRELAVRDPDPDELVEHSDCLEQARRLLGELHGS